MALISQIRLRQANPSSLIRLLKPALAGAWVVVAETRLHEIALAHVASEHLERHGGHP